MWLNTAERERESVCVPYNANGWDFSIIFALQRVNASIVSHYADDMDTAPTT